MSNDSQNAEDYSIVQQCIDSRFRIQWFYVLPVLRFIGRAVIIPRRSGKYIKSP